MNSPDPVTVMGLFGGISSAWRARAFGIPIALASWQAVIGYCAKSILEGRRAEGAHETRWTLRRRTIHALRRVMRPFSVLVGLDVNNDDDVGEGRSPLLLTCHDRGAAARRRFLLALPLLSLLPGCAESSPRLPLASQVNLEAMQGGWYIVATIPNRFEKGMVAPFDVYSLRDDGNIEENFYLRRGGFAAKVRHFTVKDTVVPGSNNASWRVHLFWPISLPFLVLYTDPAYRYVMFGENDRSLGWVFSRTPTIPDADYHALLDRFAALGYDTTRFRKVIQLPGQIGMAGFWNDGIQQSTHQ